MAKAVGPIVSMLGGLAPGLFGMVFKIIGAGISSTEAKITARRRAAQAYNASLQDRYVVVNSAVSARRFALGRVRIGGTAAYVATVGEKDEKLDRVVIACEGPIAGIAGMWLGENFLPASSFASGTPITGQYSGEGRNALSAVEQVTLDNAATFTLAHAPRSAADVLVISGVSEGAYETLSVASVAGTAVTLVAAHTGTVSVDYRYMPEDVLFKVQWQLGGRQQLNAPWPGVTTPKWTTEHRLQGVAHWRSLCDWDENVFAQGEPVQSVLTDGTLVHDARHNLSPCQDLAGAVVGAPGTLPANVSINGLGSGLDREVIGFGYEDGVPFFDLRLVGTATATVSFQVRMPLVASAVAAAPGQAWSTRAHLRVLAGALTQFSVASLAVVSYTSGGAATVEASTALSADTASLPLRDAMVAAADAALAAGAATVGTQLRFTVPNGTALDVTLRIGRPQLWQGTADPMRGSSNPAILAGWWMTLPRRDGGMGIPGDWVDWASITAAANICDELITVKKLDGTGYEQVKRYECHTLLTTEAAPTDNLITILGAMAGSRAFTAGKYRVWAGAHRVPDLVLTDRDVVSADGIRIQPAQGSGDAPPNVMNGRIIDSAKGYVESGVTPVVNNLYIDEDGGEEPDEIELPASTDARQAQYLMGVTLEQRRPRMAAELTVTGTPGANTAIGRALMLDLDGYEDFDDFTWEVRSRANLFDGRYALKLLQTKANGWALDADSFVPIEQPEPPDNDFLWNVHRLANFAAAGAPPKRLPDGSVVLRIEATWDLHDQPYVRTSGRIELRWREVETEAWAGPAVVEGTATSAYLSIAGLARMRYVVQGRAVNGIGAASEWEQITLEVAPDEQPPPDVASLSWSTEAFCVRLAWPVVDDTYLAHYELRTGGTTWETATLLSREAGNSYAWAVQLTGARKVWIKAVDIFGAESVLAAWVEVNAAVPAPTALNAAIVGPDLLLTWDEVTAAYAIDHYEVRHGATWAAGTLVDRTYTNSHRLKVAFAGSRTYWVAAVDVAGNVGAPVSREVVITAPGAVTSSRADVVDNNVLLYWAAPATGTLPVDRYEVRRGTVWASGQVIGSNGNSTFASVFEQVAGDYSYMVAAWDTANNMGPVVTIAAKVNQPPDYVLRSDLNSTFSGSLTRLYLENGALHGPVPSQTWNQHFNSNGWANIQAQIDAGHPIYANPSHASGSYQEVIDYGATVPATTVTVTPTFTLLQGSVGLACQVEWRLTTGDSWTALPAGFNAFISGNFRYLRVTLTLTTTAGANLARLSALNIKLASKLKNDAGAANAVSTDSGGTVVNFNVAFLDVASINVTPQGTGNVIAVVNFVDAANPTFFKVLLFNPATGARVSGPFSWTARGY